jgi:glycerol-3-phosphate dehydrogenase
MQRDPRSLTNTHFDVVIIGGGSFGAAAARYAALRGLRTALIERDDFGSGASAECFKMVHGGIRYLQHADVPRARGSCQERSALLRTAPHLVKPLPIAIPTYGHGRRGKLLLRAGMQAYDVLTCDRNRRIGDPARRIAPGTFLSRKQTLDLFPHLEAQDLTGAAVFEDGQMHNPARLVFAFVATAQRAGATVCNYVEATRFLFDGNTVCGLEATDRLTGDALTIKADLVLNAAGPWAEYLLGDRARFASWQRGPFSRDAYFIIDRRPTSKYALAVPGLSRDQDALLSRATRHLFMAPWRDRTLVGVWHRLFPEHPDKARVADLELQHWCDELNAVNPNLHLSADEVTFANCGLVPFGEHADANSLQFGKESRLIDHRRTHGIGGLVTLIGIRYTMARVDGERALDLLLSQRERQPAKIDTRFLTLAGGDIGNVESFRSQAHAQRPESIGAASLDSILFNHGTHYQRVLQCSASDASTPATVSGTHTLAAEIHHAVKQEMAVHLADVVMRRTDMSGDAHPGHEALRFTAQVMAQLLAWSPQRIGQELEHVERVLADHHARDRCPQRTRSTEAATGSKPEAGSKLAKLSA